jgi:hypothetical protein
MMILSEEDALKANLGDPAWRLSNLYKIITKGDDGQDAVITFKPNDSQLRFLKRYWSRNIILKCRQRGFTTLICLLWLDHALFVGNQRCGVIAQDREAAEVIFRDKVKFAYDRLPATLRQAMPLARDSASELLFAHNNSSVRVATSMRSGTIHRLLVSEFGKICSKSPDKAKEVITGSFPAVPSSGIVVIESTAEGQDGHFYRMSRQAESDMQAGKKLSKKDYRFHFFPWWEAQEYRLDPASVVISDKDNEYFDKIEASESITLSAEQRAWYIATRKADFADDEEKMWQEYPSTSMEAFQRSNEGAYYTVQLGAARKEGRITTVPYTPGVPVNTFWDIGNTDGTAIWLHQRVGLRNHFIGFIEGWGEPYAHYVAELQKKGYVWGTHHLPHDADHVRQGQVVNLSPKSMLEGLGLRELIVVPRIMELQYGIQKTRDAFADSWFDETACKEGIVHLQQYHKRWNASASTWSSDPFKDDGHSEAADAYRQFAQGYDPDAGKWGMTKIHYPRMATA